MLQIRHRQNECIGCALCVEFAPDYWALDGDGMARLLRETGRRGGTSIGEGFESDQEALTNAEEFCPVNIIKVG